MQTYKRKRHINSLFLLLGTTFNINTHAAIDTCPSRSVIETQWQQLYKTPNEQIYKPPSDTHTYPSTAVTLHWRTTPETLYQAIWHYERFSEFIPNVNTSRIVEQRDRTVWVYQNLDMPAPLRDRHYLIKSTDHGSRPTQDHYRVVWQLSDAHPLPSLPNTIAAEAFRGCWDIRADAQGHTDAVYWIQLSPSGWIPKWAAQRAMRRYVIELLQALKTRLQIPPP